MAHDLKPNQRYQHLYAIVRYQVDAAETLPIDLRIAVKKVVTDRHHAASEVERLNTLNGDKQAYYFFQITRLEGVPIEVEEVAAPTEPLRARSPAETAERIDG